MRDNRGFTVIEVMIAVFLLSFTALTFLYAMNQGHKVAGMSGQRLEALHMARDIMEQVRAQEYADISTINTTSLGRGFSYTVTVANNGTFTDTKDITVTVEWQDVASTTRSSIDLMSSATRWLH